MEQKSFEEILRDRMAETVNVKDKAGNVVKQVTLLEAAINKVIDNAVNKGDLPSIMFIRSITEGKTQDTDLEAVRQEISSVADELAKELQAQRLPPTVTAELWLLAKQLLTLRRIALTTAQPAHQDIVATPQKSGPDRLELSADNAIFNQLLKQWRTDWQDYTRQALMRHKMAGK